MDCHAGTLMLQEGLTQPEMGGKVMAIFLSPSLRRQVRCVRDEDSATYRSCAFVGNCAALALGTQSGEVRLHDTLSGDLIDSWDAHEAPVYQLRVGASLSLLEDWCPQGFMVEQDACCQPGSQWRCRQPTRCPSLCKTCGPFHLQRSPGAHADRHAGCGRVRGRRPATTGVLASKPQAWMHNLRGGAPALK